MAWLFQPCNQISPPLFFAVNNPVVFNRKKKSTLSREHSGLHNVLFLPPQLYNCLSSTNSFLPMFPFIFLPPPSVLPFHLFSSLVLIFLVLQVCHRCPLKEHFLSSGACAFLLATEPIYKINSYKDPSLLGPQNQAQSKLSYRVIKGQNSFSVFQVFTSPTRQDCALSRCDTQRACSNRGCEPDTPLQVKRHDSTLPHV